MLDHAYYDPLQRLTDPQIQKAKAVMLQIIRLVGERGEDLYAWTVDLISQNSDW
jgi:hypothetical protein